jgi:hypothetical protein
VRKGLIFKFIVGKVEKALISGNSALSSYQQYTIPVRQYTGLLVILGGRQSSLSFGGCGVG